MKRTLVLLCLAVALFATKDALYAGRYYVPEMARWATPDPALRDKLPNDLVQIQDGKLLSTSPYVYTYDNPLKYTDPDGKIPTVVVGALSGAALDIGLQVATNYFQGRPLTDIDYGSVALSAGAGAVGAGLLSKAGKLTSLLRFGSKADDAANIIDDVAKGAGNLTDDATKGAYEIAKEGGRHSGLLEQYAGKSTREIQKALGSYEKQVALHKEKLANPAKFAERWKTMSAKERQGLLRKWENDAQRNQELADIMKGLLEGGQ